MKPSGPVQVCPGIALPVICSCYQKDKGAEPDILPTINALPQFAKHRTEHHFHLHLKGLTQSRCSQKAVLAVSPTQTLTTNNDSINTVSLT